MASNIDEVQIMHEFIESKFAELYTCIPAKILSVENLSKGLVDVQASINTRRSDGSTIEFADYLDVPLMVYSANGGLANITMPIAVGDTVTLLYSQRDTEMFLAGDNSKVYDSEALRVMGEYPILAIPCSYVEGKPIEVDPDNIVIQNDKIKQTLKPDGEQTTENEIVTETLAANGDVSITNEKVTVEYLNSGDITITNGTATVEIKAGGDVDVTTSANVTVTAGGNIEATATGNLEATAATAKVTAPTITLMGNVTINGLLTVTGAATMAAVSGAAIIGTTVGTTAGADMDDIKSKYNSHTHISSTAGDPSGPADPQI
jgi:hypothetical protein